MKKITTLLVIVLFIQGSAFSQKKSGTIYSEHEALETTKGVWEAFVNGDEEKYRSYFADSVYESQNGDNQPIVANEDVGMGIANFVKNYENLKVMDHKPAYPDVLEYKEGGIWVQDWLVMTGIHKKTGIVLDLPIHNLYALNEDGKIYMIVNYFDNDVFEEISNSGKIVENGTVYINHPHIVTVRKVINAFSAGDMDEWASYYSPKARFSSSVGGLNDSHGLEEHKEGLQEMWHSGDLKFKIEQVGYPDCVFYEKSGQYVVYSWWNMKVKKGEKLYEIPYMLSHDFNDEGKIVRVISYYSSNHLEGLK